MNCPEKTQTYQELLSLKKDFEAAFVNFKSLGGLTHEERKEKVESIKQLIIEIKQKAESFDVWKNKLIKQEKEALLKYFGKAIDVPPIPAEITKEKMEFWKQNQFELHYSPGIEIKQTDNFPGQKKKLYDNFYNWIAESKISPDTNKLPTGWFLIDTRPKPQYDNGDQMFTNDILAPVLEELRKDGLIKNYKKTGSRFNVSHDELNILEVKNAFAKALRVKAEHIDLPPAAIYNYLGNAFYPVWGETNTWEWFKEKFKRGFRLSGGRSDGGGLSDVGCGSSGYRGGYLGFRLLVRFSV